MEEQGRALDRVKIAEVIVDRARERALAAARFRRQGRELLWRAQITRCEELLNTALKLDPYNYSACFMLIGCLLQLEDFRGARNQAQSTIREICQGKGAVLQEPVLHLATAYASLQVGDAHEAIDMLMEATKAFPNQPQPYVALCLAMEAAGQPAAARHAADLAVEMDAHQNCPARMTLQQRRIIDWQLRTVAVGRGVVERGGSSPKAGLIESSSKANSKEEAPPAGLKPGRAIEFRQLQFGPQALDNIPEDDRAVKEAALRDLETLFTNLMPGKPRAMGLQVAGGSDMVVSEGMSGCCSCTRRELKKET